MLLTRLAGIAALLASFLLTVPAHADSFVYEFSTNLPSFQVNGTITTGTNEGVLWFADVLDFNLLVTGGNLSETLTYANADSAGIYGLALFATDTALFFDYDVAGAGFFAANSSTGTYLCLQTYGCDSGFDAHESLGIGGNTFTEAQSGLVQVGTIQSPAPEPSSVVLVGSALLAMVAAGRSRYRAA